MSPTRAAVQGPHLGPGGSATPWTPRPGARARGGRRGSAGTPKSGSLRPFPPPAAGSLLRLAVSLRAVADGSSGERLVGDATATRVSGVTIQPRCKQSLEVHGLPRHTASRAARSQSRSLANVEVAMGTGLVTEEQVDRPSAGNPPRRRPRAELDGGILGCHGYPGSEPLCGHGQLSLIRTQGP